MQEVCSGSNGNLYYLISQTTFNGLNENERKLEKKITIMAILWLCFLYLSLTILPEKLSERAVQTEKGGKGDEKAKE